jgi:YD repeat-containing protein
MIRYLFSLISILLFAVKVQAQLVEYQYDKANRLTQVVYKDQMTIAYTYDSNGNRVSKITSTIVTNVSNLNDSILQSNGNVFIYPNPSNGNFKTRIYSSQKQTVTVQIFTVEGKLIHTYTVEALKGYYDININISPKPSGTYVVTVTGKTVHASKQLVIID